ncbi:MAG: type II CRISPR-associated endonuclease Cas1 [bacterium]
MDRVIDFSEEPASLSVRNFLLHIKRDEKETVTIPLAEISVMVVSHPRVTYTQSVLAGLCMTGGTFITCDEKHLPVGILLPIAANFAQTERFTQQANVSEPTKKRLWQQVVKAKITAQAKLLNDLHGDDFGMLEFVGKVHSGDSGNIEAQASRLYWQILFNNPDFKRDRVRNDQNRFLNYGYTVLRAIVARGICAAGLHPSLGIHHHNRYDAFCLASDLMEPLRPSVDRVVVKIVDEFGADAPMDKEVKGALMSAFLERYELDGESRTLFDIAAKTASSLVQVFAGESNKLVLPEI